MRLGVPCVLLCLPPARPLQLATRSQLQLATRLTAAGYAPLSPRPSRAGHIAATVYQVSGASQLDTVMAQSQQMDGLVVLYYTEAGQRLANEQFEQIADQFEVKPGTSATPQTERTLFIQLTREAEGQELLIAQRGIYAYPTVEVWKDGARRETFAGLAGVTGLPQVLSSYGVFRPAQPDGAGGPVPKPSPGVATRTDGQAWSNW